jgi:hypothetical protein
MPALAAPAERESPRKSSSLSKRARRPLLHFVIALALMPVLILAACGGDGDGGDEPSSQGNVDGSWEGTTSQRKVIAFTVSGGIVTKLRIAWDYAGSKCGIVGSRVELSPKARVTDRKFRIKEPPIEGTFDSDTEATGTLDVEPDPVEAGCKAVDVRWVAHPSGT